VGGPLGIHSNYQQVLQGQDNTNSNVNLQWQGGQLIIISSRRLKAAAGYGSSSGNMKGT
jgi:hypothetical protein